MALKKRSIKNDILWLRWPVSLLGVVVAASLGLFASASMFRNEMQRDEFNALSDFDMISGQVAEIEQAESIITDNFGRYETMLANGVMREEDRVQLLEDITSIRQRHMLFPINVEIGEESRLFIPYPEEVDFPDEQITLRESQVRVSYALLHEEDLTRFLAEFLDGERLMVPTRCSMAAALESEEMALEIVQHQLANCEFNWYTFRQEPYLGF